MPAATGTVGGVDVPVTQTFPIMIPFAALAEMLESVNHSKISIEEKLK